MNVHLEQTNINEFTELNTAVNIMTKKASSDYNEIKSFTENASHEIQTPLGNYQVKTGIAEPVRKPERRTDECHSIYFRNNQSPFKIKPVAYITY